jgi:1-acyl-sn-glycerol-3-phosphate acyltransferase
MHPLHVLLKQFDPSDLSILLPHVGLWHAFRLATGPREPNPPVDPADRDPAFVQAVVDAGRWIGRHWFRWRHEGVENVPRDGPVLLVGNHSGGLMVFDGILTLVAVNDAQGPRRAPHGMAHEFVFRDPILRNYAIRAGVVPSTPEGARSVFARGGIAAAYPGSDWDSLRPFSQRNRIFFGGRYGFIRLALREQVPLVPVVTAGAQEMFIILTRGERIARALGMRERLKSNVFPIGFSLPWGIGPSFLPYFPLPTPIITSFMQPFRWPDLGPDAADDPAIVRRCHDEVLSVMQARMDALTRDRIPWIG